MDCSDNVDLLFPTLSDSRRLAQVIGILGRHGLNGISASLGIGRSRGDVAPPRPDAVVSALREIGPVAVKFGQVLAMRSDMLPPEWTTALATLQDRVPACPFAEVQHSLEAALGAPVSDCFEYLDEMPLAAGSIAQVHAAVRRDGAPVIIKIRRPGIEEIVDADLRLLRRLARLAQRVNPAIARQRPDELLRFFAESLDREMDLSAEGNASDEIGALSGGFGVEVPFDLGGHRKEHQYSGAGRWPACDRAAGAAARRGHRHGASGANLRPGRLEMIVINGRFHADPLSRNILIRTDGTVVFIDFGAVGTLLPHRRDELVDLSLAIAGERPLWHAFSCVGAGDPAVDREALARALAGLIDRFKASVLDQIDLGEVFADVFRLLREFELSLPPDLALMLRTLLTAEGFVRRIDPRFDIGAELAPIVRQLLRERAGFGEMARQGASHGRASGAGGAECSRTGVGAGEDRAVGPIADQPRPPGSTVLASGSRQRPLAGHHVISAALVIAASHSTGGAANACRSMRICGCYNHRSRMVSSEMKTHGYRPELPN